jgi:hypothetical protein
LGKFRDQAGASLGVSVSTAGDVNNDGYSDIIIGADYYTVNELTNTGKAFVYHGSASGLSELLIGQLMVDKLVLNLLILFLPLVMLMVMVTVTLLLELINMILERLMKV